MGWDDTLQPDTGNAGVGMDRKNYVIIKFKKGLASYNEYDYIIGINDDKKYLNYILEKYNKILNSIPDEYQKKRKYYQSIISEINKRIKNM